MRTPVVRAALKRAGIPANIRAMKYGLSVTLVLAVVALASLPFAASADETFRCGKWIVSSSLSTTELTAKCGRPTARASETHDVMSRNRNNGLLVKTGETTVETWTYDRGPGAAPMVVTIVDGRIKSIDRQK
jgi:hypothetical protein